jgi:hypothetical protein
VIARCLSERSSVADDEDVLFWREGRLSAGLGVANIEVEIIQFCELR